MWKRDFAAVLNDVKSEVNSKGQKNTESSAFKQIVIADAWENGASQIHWTVWDWFIEKRKSNVCKQIELIVVDI